MPISTNDIQVQWGGSNSSSVAGGGTDTSDTVSFSGAAYEAKITCKADHSGTPGSGDVVHFYLLETVGDPDGSSSDEFDTEEQGTYLGVLDTNANDPAVRTFTFSPPKSGQIYVVNDAGESITVSATVREKTA